MTVLSRRITLAMVVIVCVGADQALKQAAMSSLQYSPSISYIGDFVRLQYAENSGIMLSLCASFTPEMRFWLFTVAVGLLLAGMFAYALWGKGLSRAQVIAWSLILSGGLGNFVDRVMRDGVVIDYISVGIGVVRTAVFNLADALVFVGVFLLLIAGRKSVSRTVSGGNVEEGGQSSSTP